MNGIHNKFVPVYFKSIFVVLWFLSNPAFTQECPELTPSSLIVQSQPFPTSGLTVTNFDASWFEAGGVSFFTITINNAALSTPASLGRLKLGVLITGRVKGSISVPRVLVDALYRLEPRHIGVPLSSDQVFDMDEVGDESTFITRSTLNYFKDDNGNLLPIELNAVFRLTCDDNINRFNWQQNIALGEIGSFNGVIDPSLQNIDAIYPGTPNPANPGITMEEYPMFHFNSGLSSSEIKYDDNEIKFIIYLVEVMEGESPVDAIENASIPLVTIYENQSTSRAQYPYNRPALREGVMYAWKVSMRLRGPVDRWVPSAPMFFTFTRDPNAVPPNPLSPLKEVENFISVGDDYNRRLLAALKIILEENYEIFITSLGNRIPVKGQIRWNGQPYSLEQLEKLAQTFSRKNNSLIRMRFRQ